MSAEHLRDLAVWLDVAWLSLVVAGGIAFLVAYRRQRRPRRQSRLFGECRLCDLYYHVRSHGIVVPPPPAHDCRDHLVPYDDWEEPPRRLH